MTTRNRRRGTITLAALCLAAAALSAPEAALATPAPALSIRQASMPTIIPTTLTGGNTGHIVILVSNLGAAPSEGPISIADEVPSGLVIESVEAKTTPAQTPVTCSVVAQAVKCQYEGVLPADGKEGITVVVSAHAAAPGPLAANVAAASGGGSRPITSEARYSGGSALPEFGLTKFEFAELNGEGLPDTQAGSHPNLVSVATEYTSELAGAFYRTPHQVAEVPGLVRDVDVTLPPGLIGNPLAATQCPQYDVAANGGGRLCPASSIVGVVDYSGQGPVYEASSGNNETAISFIHNVVPEHGVAAEFAISNSGYTAFIYVTLAHSGGEYVIRASVPAIPQPAALKGADLVFFGVPAEVDGGAVLPTPMFSQSTACGAQQTAATVATQSWLAPESAPPIEASALQPAVTGCDRLHFAPTVKVTPENAEVGQPTGATVDLAVPQTTHPNELATPPVSAVTVTLTPSLRIAPPSANGLKACPASGPEGINLFSEEPLDVGEPQGVMHLAHGKCPGASVIGSATVSTPILAKPLTGSLYLAQPECEVCTEADAEEGRLVKVYLEAEGPGVNVKLPGTVEVGGHGAHSAAAGLAPGQLRAHFANLPQQPVSDVSVTLKGGPYAALANELQCGRHETSATVVPWGSPEVPTATPAAVFETGLGGSACPATFPFAPTAAAGLSTPLAGGFSPIDVSLHRADGEQDLEKVAVQTPPGLLAKTAGIPRCTEAQANSASCPAASRIGTTTVAVGDGASPYTFSGSVYLTESYEGAPFGLAIVVPAVAGPFNLGNVVVRARIDVDPFSGALTVTSDALPKERDGVPIHLRDVAISIDRPGFAFGPTSCVQQSLGVTATSSPGAEAAAVRQEVKRSIPFAVTGCSHLPFAPQFAVSTAAHTSKANGAALEVKVAAKPGEANFHKVTLQLPTALPSRLTTLQKACSEAQFDANPSGCPEGSNIGTATAHTPILNVPLTGPAYLVSHGNAAFPDVEFLLQGEGVKIVLDGKTDIKKGITYSRFETVPDAPISSFEVNLPEGPHSALAAPAGHLCEQKLIAPTTIVGQNGAQVSQSTRVDVEGCSSSFAVISKKVKRRNVMLSVYAPAAGSVRVSGKGVSTVTKAYSGREALTFTLHQNRAGKLRTKLKLTFTPKNGRRQTRTAEIKFAV
jgi:hypothetical protein